MAATKEMESVIQALKQNNYSVIYVDKAKYAIPVILEMISPDDSIEMAGAASVSQLGILDLLRRRGNKGLDFPKPGEFPTDAPGRLARQHQRRHSGRQARQHRRHGQSRGRHDLRSEKGHPADRREQNCPGCRSGSCRQDSEYNFALSRQIHRIEDSLRAVPKPAVIVIRPSGYAMPLPSCLKSLHPLISRLCSQAMIWDWDGIPTGRKIG